MKIFISSLEQTGHAAAAAAAADGDHYLLFCPGPPSLNCEARTTVLSSAKLEGLGWAKSPACLSAP